MVNQSEKQSNGKVINGQLRTGGDKSSTGKMPGNISATGILLGNKHESPDLIGIMIADPISSGQPDWTVGSGTSCEGC